MTSRCPVRRRRPRRHRPRRLQSGAPAAESGGKASIAASVKSEAAPRRPSPPRPGQVLFVITNTGTDPAEFEIIGPDQKVIDEAENIVPGFVVNLKSRLDGGTYELVCGTLTSPRGSPDGDRWRRGDPPAERGRRPAAIDAARRRVPTPTSSPSPTTSSRSSTRSPRPSMPATSRRPRRPTARRACRGSGSSRSPSCSPTSTQDRRPRGRLRGRRRRPRVHRLPPAREGASSPTARPTARAS